MRGWTWLVVLVGTAAAAGACGSSVDSGGQGGSGATGSTTSNGTTGNGTTTTTGTGGASPSGCPADAPTGGPPCAEEGLLCTYGEEQRPECRITASCSGGTWIVSAPPCAVPGPGTCPTAPPPSNDVCPEDGAVCTYDDGAICECTTCLGGPCGPPPPVWICGAPGPGCPTIAPNAGTACGQEQQSCTYGNPCGISGVIAVCQDGAWIWDVPVCPQ
jgi:hypothetical protein